MILHQNSIIKLEYNPATDILEVKYPDLQKFMLFEIKESLKLMVSTVRNYDVKRLLLDASQTLIEINDEENRDLTISLATELSKTRLQKVARIKPVDLNKEARAQENIKQIEKSGSLPFAIRTFSDRADAINWLIGSSD
ncbi:hypothetical protein ABID22_002493 [Pontibacter aydingkolensis]|uniref:Uncharacterized protein n=1 Tax=Pontibacter aydingkolensis TaxID=1911536 RepID=A0ABS7CWG5_9BACT|nr:hypothetical protein [Pontibacter aydingkolensis]MBW7468174.1 hypothetical protein [Pontibacter aydingkolensis]